MGRIARRNWRGKVKWWRAKKTSWGVPVRKSNRRSKAEEWYDKKYSKR